MADTTSPAKKYYDQANQAIDEQAILDKYNAATMAQFNVQREQNRQAENNFYNQMYNTQKTAMDTIRQSNAAAVSSGASRGVQAANELSALLGLQQESVASATELAQANRQTAQEETAAVLENVLKAYQQAQQERAQMVQHGIEAASVDVQSEANKTAAQTNRANLITSAAENGTTTYLQGLAAAGVDYSNGVMTPESTTSINVALAGSTTAPGGGSLTFSKDTWNGDKNGSTQGSAIRTNFEAIISAYGLDPAQYTTLLDDFTAICNETDVDGMGAANTADDIFNKYNLIPDGKRINGREEYAQAATNFVNYIKTKIYNDYTNGLNRKPA
jgi:hypothetical protein